MKQRKVYKKTSEKVKHKKQSKTTKKRIVYKKTKKNNSMCAPFIEPIDISNLSKSKKLTKLSFC